MHMTYIINKCCIKVNTNYVRPQEKIIVRPCSSFEYNTYVNKQYLFIDVMYNMTLGQEKSTGELSSDF